MTPDILKQQEQLLKDPHPCVEAACTSNEGILVLAEEELKLYGDVVIPDNTCFFIPASGAGSRMFGFLFQFLLDGIETEEVKKFFRHLEDFPFFAEMQSRLGADFSRLDQKEIVSFILSNSGLDLAELPKGLIPFHKYENKVVTPFEEHLSQIDELLSGDGDVQYTVQKRFLDQIKNKISSGYQGSLQVEYSFQDSESDAYCFDVHGNPVLDGDTYLRRPAGHGALLQNLDALSSDIVFVKNIDNIQPRNKAAISETYWKVLYGLLSSLNASLMELKHDFTTEKLAIFNEQFHLFRNEDLSSVDHSMISEMCERPSRVCGMVINEGAPGGGPFWVRTNGVVSKQIVEKVQLKNDTETSHMLEESTHFNPVFMVLDLRSPDGKRCVLNEFVDHDSFIRVEKDQKGEKVIYHELPGLWNGSMSKWNTVFVEVDKRVFTPVKTVMDLIGPDHLS